MKKSLKSFLLLLVCLSLVGILVACGKTKTPTEPTDDPETPAKVEITADAVSLAVSETEYTGEEIEPEVTVVIDGITLTLGEDYTVDYSNNVSVGTAKVFVQAVDGSNYTGIVTKTFEITKILITKDYVRLSPISYTLADEVEDRKPTVIISRNNLNITNCFDINYEGYNRTSSGDAYVVISVKNEYADIYTVGDEGTLRVAYNIGEFVIDETTATITITGLEKDEESGMYYTYYTGEQICPTVTIVYNGTTLTQWTEENSEGADYIVKYDTNLMDGGYIYIFAADGSEYNIDITIWFQILKYTVDTSNLIEGTNGNTYTFSNNNVTITYNTGSGTYSVTIKYDENTVLSEYSEDNQSGDYVVSCYAVEGDGSVTVYIYVSCQGTSVYQFASIDISFTYNGTLSGTGDDSSDDNQTGDDDDDLEKE